MPADEGLLSPANPNLDLGGEDLSALGWRDLWDARRCEKLLWHRLHRRSDVPRSPEMIFDQGAWIEDLVWQAFPQGHLAGGGVPEAAHLEVRQWDGDAVLWNPMVGTGRVWARASVMAPFRGGAELLLATEAMNLRDGHLAEGAWVLRQFQAAGLAVKRIRLLLLDRSYMRRGPVDPHQLFRGQDITAAVTARSREIPGLLRRVEQVREKPQCPAVATGSYCQHPIPCPLYDRCHERKARHHVTRLTRGRRTAEDLMARGITTMAEVPDTWPLSEAQAIQVRAVKTGAPQVDREAIGKFLQGVRYPLHLLDFEACQTPVPFVSGTQPYQVVPVQYSIHIIRGPGQAPEGRHFLAPYGAPGEDPRVAMLAQLKKDLEGAAMVGAFNAGFETTRLKEMASTFPEHEDWIKKLLPRFIDFWEPFRQFWWYHPDQEGRTGVKTLMPLVSGRRYEDLEIGDGHTASLAWLKVHVGPRGEVSALPEEEREGVRGSLIRYCSMDTEALVAIHDFLHKVVGGD